MAEFADLRVFVSYAHDNARHKDAVLALCELIGGRGVDVHLDRQQSSTRRDWYAWMIDNVVRADYVVVVASPRYRRAGDGTAAADQSRGVQAEASLLRDLLHADRPTWTRKLLPVVLPGSTVEEIPLFLQPYCADHYLIDTLSPAGVAPLLNAITSADDARLDARDTSSQGTSTAEGSPKNTTSHHGWQNAVARRRSTIIQVGGDLTLGEPGRAHDG